jgi:hypothetical protein
MNTDPMESFAVTHKEAQAKVEQMCKAFPTSGTVKWENETFVFSFSSIVVFEALRVSSDLWILRHPPTLFSIIDPVS